MSRFQCTRLHTGLCRLFPQPPDLEKRQLVDFARSLAQHTGLTIDELPGSSGCRFPFKTRSTIFTRRLPKRVAELP